MINTYDAMLFNKKRNGVISVVLTPRRRTSVFERKLKKELEKREVC